MQKFELRYKNGTEEGQWCLVACQPVKNPDGVVSSIIGAVTDISTQKKSERIALDRAEALEQAKASEDRFRRFMQVSRYFKTLGSFAANQCRSQIAPIGCMIADTTKGVQFVNEAWWELSQHPRVPMEQIDWNSVLYEEDLDIAEEGWQVSETYFAPLVGISKCFSGDQSPRGQRLETTSLANFTHRLCYVASK